MRYFFYTVVRSKRARDRVVAALDEWYVAGYPHTCPEDMPSVYIRSGPAKHEWSGYIKAFCINDSRYTDGGPKMNLRFLITDKDLVRLSNKAFIATLRLLK